MNEYSKFKLNLDKNKSINVVVYDPSKEKADGKLSDVGAIHHIHVLDRSGSMYGSINELIDNVQKSFEHIEDDGKALNEISRVLKPGGKCILMVPATPFLWGLQGEVAHHFRRYTKRSLFETVNKEVEAIQDSFSKMVNPLTDRMRVARYKKAAKNSSKRT